MKEDTNKIRHPLSSYCFDDEKRIVKWKELEVLLLMDWKKKKIILEEKKTGYLLDLVCLVATISTRILYYVLALYASYKYIGYHEIVHNTAYASLSCSHLT